MTDRPSRRLTRLAPLACLIAVSFVPSPAQAPQATTSAAIPARDEKLWARAIKLHRSSIVIDGHNDITSPMVDEGYDIGTPSAGKYHTDLQRIKDGGLSAQFFSIYVDSRYVKSGGSARRAMDMIDMVYRAAERHPQDIRMAYSVADIRRAKREGKLAAMMGIEGGHAIENSLSALRDFYRLGVRYMTLTHSNTNDWADSSGDVAKHNGLTEFGKEIVREMNRIGMLVDISHVSDKTMHDVLDLTDVPVIASHSSARAIANVPRNIPDDLLKKIAKNGGVVMVNFFNGFINNQVAEITRERNQRIRPQIDELNEKYKDDPRKLRQEILKLQASVPLPIMPPTTVANVADHIDHIVKVAGIDHVGLGSDYDGVPQVPEGLEDVSKYPNLTYELLRRGYSDADVRKILGENLLRVFAAAEAKAAGSRLGISATGSVMRVTEK